MKKQITLLLVLVMALSLSACGGEQAAETGEETQEAEVSTEVESTEPSESDNSVIEFDDAVVYEDENAKIELLAFYEEEMNWSEGTKNEKNITLKLYNKSEYDLFIDLVDLYVGDDQVTASMSDGTMTAAPGKNGTFRYIIWYDSVTNSLDHTALDSLEDLYSLEGRLDIRIDKDVNDNKIDDSYKASFDLKSIIPNNATEETKENDGSDMDTSSSLYGTWEVVEVKTASDDLTVAEMESHKVYSWSDWNIIVSDTGELYLQTNNTSAKSDTAVVTGSDITAGNNKWTLEGDRLVLNSGGATAYYEKISDNQTFPELEKKALVDMLKGSWSINSSSRTGDFTFTDKTATATINGVVFNADTLCIDMKDNRIIISAVDSGNQISMDLSYTYDNGALSLSYSGDTLTKQ